MTSWLLSVARALATLLVFSLLAACSPQVSTVISSSTAAPAATTLSAGAAHRVVFDDDLFDAFQSVLATSRAEIWTENPAAFVPIAEEVLKSVVEYANTHPVPPVSFNAMSTRRWTAACMEAVGLTEVELDPDGGIGAYVGMGLGSESNQFKYDACYFFPQFSELSTDDPVTDEEYWRLRYQEMSRVSLCLTEGGFPVDDLPSITVYLETHDYWPYSGLGYLGPISFPQDVTTLTDQEFEAFLELNPEHAEIAQAMRLCTFHEVG